MKSIGNKNHNKKMNKNSKPNINNLNIKNNINDNSKRKNNTYPNDILGLFRRLGIE